MATRPRSPEDDLIPKYGTKKSHAAVFVLTFYTGGLANLGFAAMMRTLRAMQESGLRIVRNQ